jgi:hypothetical protein
MTKIISDHSETDPIKHITAHLLDCKADLLEYESWDYRTSEEDRVRGTVDGLAFVLAYLQTLSPQAISKLARDTLHRTHPLLDTYDVNLNPPKDASYFNSNIWCVSDVRHHFGDKVLHMSDEDIASGIQDLYKSIEGGATESGWDAISYNFEITDDEEEE